MASLLPGFEYDIFISYRQKDNKYDGWVTEFVDHLKGELESTFKEDISVYFDINPHDGLLETHDVDASLKEKLKCLVFIPIISRTYCDPKSFAWEHEFKAFVEQATQDKFGLKIKLPNGNVANRILPVRIHDLDIADIKLCELVLDGVLRGVEFIYKEPGVNRSLTPDDDEKNNLNKTRYRNQINKVALAINEIIQGLKTEPEWLRLKERIDTENHKEYEETRERTRKAGKEKPVKSGKRKLISILVIVAILLIAAILAYPKIFKRNTLEKLQSSGERISVAVMPFQNMTGDTTMKNWQDMIQFSLSSSLSSSEDLIIRQIESIDYLIKTKGLTNYDSFTPVVARSISRKLNADVFIHGGILKAGPSIRIDARLIDSKTGTILRSFPVNVTSLEEVTNKFIDSLAFMVREFLLLSELTQKRLPDQQLPLVSISSSDAYRNYISGKNAFAKHDWDEAIEYLSEAVRIDPDFTFAAILLSWSYANQGHYEKGKECHLRIYEKKDSMPLHIRTKLMFQHAGYFEGPMETIRYLKLLADYDDQDPFNFSDLGDVYNNLGQYDNAIPEFKKALDIYKKWGSKPFWINQYTGLASAYHKTGQFGKERRILRKAESDFPDDPALIERQAILALSKGKVNAANEYIDKYKSIRRNKMASEAVIATSLAEILSEAGIPDKAEEYHRQALLAEPENPIRMNNLARFLIDKDRNINEGLELIEKALEINPDNYEYLDTKAWGLYKQGNYMEAFELLEKSWELKPVYNHEIYLHLEAAKKAVASQKDN